MPVDIFSLRAFVWLSNSLVLFFILLDGDFGGYVAYMVENGHITFLYSPLFLFGLFPSR